MRANGGIRVGVNVAARGGVAVGVEVGLAVSVGVTVAVGVIVGVGLDATVPVAIGVVLGACVGVAVCVGVDVGVGVGVGGPPRFIETDRPVPAARSCASYHAVPSLNRPSVAAAPEVLSSGLNLISRAGSWMCTVMRHTG